MHCNATLWDYLCTHSHTFCTTATQNLYLRTSASLPFTVFMHTALKTIHPLSLFRLHTQSTCTLQILDMFLENTQCTFTFSLFFTFHTHTVPTGTHLHKICYITHALFGWKTVFSLSFSIFFAHTHTTITLSVQCMEQLLQRLHTSHHKAHIVVKSPWIRSGGTRALLCLRSL